MSRGFCFLSVLSSFLKDDMILFKCYTFKCMYQPMHMMIGKLLWSFTIVFFFIFSYLSFCFIITWVFHTFENFIYILWLMIIPDFIDNDTRLSSDISLLLGKFGATYTVLSKVQIAKPEGWSVSLAWSEAHCFFFICFLFGKSQGSSFICFVEKYIRISKFNC